MWRSARHSVSASLNPDEPNFRVEESLLTRSVTPTDATRLCFYSSIEHNLWWCRICLASLFTKEPKSSFLKLIKSRMHDLNRTIKDSIFQFNWFITKLVPWELMGEKKISINVMHRFCVTIPVVLHALQHSQSTFLLPVFVVAWKCP